MTRIMNAGPIPTPIARTARKLRLALLILPLAFALGCSPQAGEETAEPAGIAPTEAPVEAGLATLTARSPGSESGQMQAPTPAAGAGSGLEGLVGGDVDLPMPEDSDISNAPVSGDPYAEAANARATADAAAGVPNVDSLVMSMPPLATFTPAPRAAEPEEALIYVRNGSFWRAGAGQARPSQVQLGSEVPSLWAPPEDPGRAWMSPDGRQMAFFAGSDAEMWVAGVDGRAARAVSGPNLPPEIHQVSAGSAEQDVRLQPGRHYTLVRMAGGEEPFAVLIDDLSEQRRGYARLRFVHAIEGLAAQSLQVYVNGQPFGGPMRYGRSSGEIAIAAGPLTVELRDLEGEVVSALPDFEAVSKQIVSVFLVGRDAPRAVNVLTEHENDPGTASQVRIFNASQATLDARLDGEMSLVGGLEPDAIGPFVRVPATLSTEQRSDLQLGIYGNKTNEQPVVWSPDGTQLAFIGGGDGQVDIYATNAAGQLRRVTQDALREFNPVWSPDGHLAWLSEESAVVLLHLYYQRAGGEIVEVDPTPIRQAQGLAPTEKVFYPEDPIWIDGDRLALMPSANNVSLGMWVLDTRDGGLQQIYDGTVTDPDWSAEAGAWVFNPDEETGRLIVLEPDGQQRTLVEGDAFNAIWSPDGSRISYVEGQRMIQEGWRIHVIDADGGNDRTLTPRWPLIQFEPPVPGPNAKRYWLDGGERILFSRVGRDYGAAERAGIGRVQEAGPDLENWYSVRVDGSQDAPQQVTDLTQSFYLDNLEAEPAGDFLAFTGLWYKSRTQQLWAVPADGGPAIQIDGPVRWFAWLP